MSYYQLLSCKHGKGFLFSPMFSYNQT